MLRPFFCLVLLLSVSLAQAQQVASVPLTDQRMPSDDLVCPGCAGHPDVAWNLKRAGTDLSRFDPYPSAIWSPGAVSLSPSLDQLPVNDNDTAEFAGPLLSAVGLFRFNVRAGGTTAIVHLDKTLHTMLLRKAILRRLGYKIPAMKWVRTLNVRFANADEMKTFTDSQIPRATNGAASRWVVRKDDAGFMLTLRDVAITVPDAQDPINVSMGVPPKTLTGRVLRGLLLPYAWLNLSESANEFEWTVGRVSNNEIQLPHFTRGQFTTTMDDARWMLNRMAQLSTADIQAAVAEANVPPEVGLLLVEKLASRRNALFKTFGVAQAELPFNLKVSSLPALKDGKLKREDWDGYASRFAHGDPDSPFKDIHLYALSLLQSLVIDNLVAKANQEMSFFNPNDKRVDFYHKQFLTGLNHFVKTGEFLQFPVSAWTQPVANLGLNLSRDVVVGNYLGTDNLVQLADTIGWTVQLGVHVGVENTRLVETVSFRDTATYAQNWTHLKPLRNLKQVFKEPYKNLLVPLIKWQLRKELDRLHTIGQSQHHDVDWDLKKDNSALSQIIRHINETLGVGESLIYTERLSPVLSGSISSTMMGTPVTFRLNAQADMVELRRIQIYRKDSKTIQVYDDRGDGIGWSVDFTIERFIPILRLGWRQQRGGYTVKMHEVNIDSSLEDNPRLFDSGHAFAEFLRTGSGELLEAIQKPQQIKTSYKDRSSRFAFLFWRYKKLKTDATFDIQTRDDLKGKYILLTDESQTGFNWESFVKDLVNYGFSRISQDVEWAPPTWQNPAQTIAGVGKTKSVRFEAELADDGSYQQRFMRLSDEWEGWSESVGGLQNYMRETNLKFGFTVFDEGALNNARSMKLYDVIVALNLYEAGIQRLAQIPLDRLIVLENRYEHPNGDPALNCDEQQIRTRRLSSGQQVDSCGSLNDSIWYNRSCQSKIAHGEDQKDVSKCLMKLLRSLYNELPYSDLAKLLGEDNIFVHGSINGFRSNDEVLNDPIPANTHGRIGGPNWNGPFDRIQQLLGIQSGELNGYWLRERL